MSMQIRNWIPFSRDVVEFRSEDIYDEDKDIGLRYTRRK